MKFHFLHLLETLEVRRAESQLPRWRRQVINVLLVLLQVLQIVVDADFDVLARLVRLKPQKLRDVFFLLLILGGDDSFLEEQAVILIELLEVLRILR